MMEKSIAANRQLYECCPESMTFLVQDQKGNDFHIGIGLVLECLSFAISDGELPKLPSSWIRSVGDRHGVSFSEEAWYNEPFSS